MIWVMCSDETRHAVFASRLHNLSHLQSCIFCLWNSLEFFGSTAVDGRKLVTLMDGFWTPENDGEHSLKRSILKRLILVVTFVIVNSTLHSIPCRQGLMSLVLRGQEAKGAGDYGTR